MTSSIGGGGAAAAAAGGSQCSKDELRKSVIQTVKRSLSGPATTTSSGGGGAGGATQGTAAGGGGGGGAAASTQQGGTVCSAIPRSGSNNSKAVAAWDKLMAPKSREAVAAAGGVDRREGKQGSASFQKLGGASSGHDTERGAGSVVPKAGGGLPRNDVVKGSGRTSSGGAGGHSASASLLAVDQSPIVDLRNEASGGRGGVLASVGASGGKGYVSGTAPPGQGIEKTPRLALRTANAKWVLKQRQSSLLLIR